MEQKIEVRIKYDKWAEVSREVARFIVEKLILSLYGTNPQNDAITTIEHSFLRGITVAELFRDKEGDND